MLALFVFWSALVVFFLFLVTDHDLRFVAICFYGMTCSKKLVINGFVGNGNYIDVRRPKVLCVLVRNLVSPSSSF